MSLWALKEEARRRDRDNIDRHVATKILGVTLRTPQRWHRRGTARISEITREVIMTALIGCDNCEHLQADSAVLGKNR